MKWVFVGSLGSGERVYFNTDFDLDNNLAIEKDHAHLLDPTPEEMVEILKNLSHVRVWIKEHRKGGN